MDHAPAECFKIAKRGFIRDGYWADLTVFDLNQKYLVTADTLYYKCGWSPFDGHEFDSKVLKHLFQANLFMTKEHFLIKRLVKD